jgi:hypothetical protein
MSRDVEFCKTQLRSMATFGSASSLRAKVKQFLFSRLPKSARERAELRDWATRELTRLEAARESGVNKVGFNVGEIDRLVATCQTAIEEIDATEAREARRHSGEQLPEIEN